MTETSLHKLLNTWKQRLGLSQWQIELKPGCDDEDSFMEIQRQAQYDRAVIFYQPWLLTGEAPPGVIDLTLTDQMIEEKLVHELLHCYTAGMVGVIQDDIDGMLHRDAHTIMTEVFRREEERCVDRLAHALVCAFSDR